MQRIEVNFVDKYNTSIVGIRQNKSNIVENIKVFYNCGELDWSYTVSDYVVGPNYNLSIINQ
jgi:hypothetical protein